jgi:hypothetical protein
MFNIRIRITKKIPLELKFFCIDEIILSGKFVGIFFMKSRKINVSLPWQQIMGFWNLKHMIILHPNSVWFRGIFYVWGAAPRRLRRECGVRRRKRGWLAVPQYIVRVLHVREGLGRSLTSFSRAQAAAPQSSHSQQLCRLRPPAPPTGKSKFPSKAQNNI